MADKLLLCTVDKVSGREIREGGMVVAHAIDAADVWRSLRAIYTKIFGGTLPRYEDVQSRTLQNALEKLEEAAREQGYDGVVGIRLATPRVTEGAVELIAYGTGFHFVEAGSSD